MVGGKHLISSQLVDFTTKGVNRIFSKGVNTIKRGTLVCGLKWSPRPVPKEPFTMSKGEGAGVQIFVPESKTRPDTKSIFGGQGFFNFFQQNWQNSKAPFFWNWAELCIDLLFPIFSCAASVNGTTYLVTILSALVLTVGCLGACLWPLTKFQKFHQMSKN